MIEQDARQAAGARLREFRVSLGVTQEELAKLLKVKRQTVSAWEHGTAMPSGKGWLRLGRMGMSLDYVVLGIRTMPVSAYAKAPMVRLPVVTPPAAVSGTHERQPTS